MPDDSFRSARDFLLAQRANYGAAYAGFHWPRPDRFNWALDWFDPLAAGNAATGLWIVEEDGSERRWTFDDLYRRSNQVANWLRQVGVKRGDPIVLMVGNRVELWESVLAAIKLGAVMIPSTTLLGPADLQDRVDRGHVRHVLAAAEAAGSFGAVKGEFTRIGIGSGGEGWLDYRQSEQAPAVFDPGGITMSSDPLLLYFTSGTTALPKLVEHTHISYPIGHLSTMYWIGLQPGDVHLNISSPGWAKHAWSNVFAPWNAEATVVVFNYARFSAEMILHNLVRCQVDTFCAPPTVWRMLIQADLAKWPVRLREAVSAGEPLNPEVIDQVRRAWNITIRDGFGQTETTAQVANSPGQVLKPGSMGRALPGFHIELRDPLSGTPGNEGEICVRMDPLPVGLMVGYRGDAERTAEAMRDGYYHTGDVASRDEDGYITYVGRTDDVFKASDYRISPFELESVLLEHEAVAETAVVPAPDAIRLSVPKAYVVLASGFMPDAATARAIFEHSRSRLAPFKRIRRLEFAELPKTISGKIRRVELRQRAATAGDRPPGEFRDQDYDD
jgi:acetyl-CoA synthetase